MSKAVRQSSLRLKPALKAGSQAALTLLKEVSTMLLCEAGDNFEHAHRIPLPALRVELVWRMLQKAIQNCKVSVRKSY